MQHIGEKDSVVRNMCDCISLNDLYNYIETKGYPLLEHQKEGIKWMLEREKGILPCKSIKGGLLCDDPGLGKTIQTCSTMYGNPKNKTLIILPISIVNQWIKVLKCIFPNSNIHFHHGKNKLKTTKIDNIDIVVTTLSMLYNRKSETTILHYICWDRVIIDEIHYIRNSCSKSFKSVLKLKSYIKWGLTGTPIQNSINDLANLYKFLLKKKNSKFYSQKSIINSLEKLNEYCLKRRRKDEIKELYELSKKIKINDIDIVFDTKEERDLYIKIKNNTTTEFNNIINSNLSIRDQMVQIFELLLRLRQISIHPQIAINGLKKKNNDIVYPNFNKNSSKLNKILEIVKSKINNGVRENTIIFCYFKDEMNFIKTMLENNKIKSEIYDGSLNIKQKQNVLNQFVETNSLNILVSNRYIPKDCREKIDFYIPKVLIMQIKSGSVGLNLQKFNNIIFTLPDWNPSNQIQAIARSHRIGQKLTTNIYNIYLKDNIFDTIDDRIIDIQLEKKQIIAKYLKEPLILQQQKQKLTKLNFLDYTKLF